MQTSTQRPARTRKPATTAQVATPFSPAAAKLIAQVQAEAREQLLNELSAKDGITVLHGFDAETKTVRADGDSIHICDDKGNSIDFYRRHLPPESWKNSPSMVGYWHPARWYGDQTMVDASSSEWSRNLGIFVCDDFGKLVAVQR